jgi:hypothetical protein
MYNDVFQSLHESVKKRNTPDAFLVDSPDSIDVIHRGYIKDAAFPIKYDFIPKNKKTRSKNEGSHIYSFANEGMNGVVEINHRTNSNIESGHETTSTFSMETPGFPSDVFLRRTILPAVMHHIDSHQPDILKFEKGFKFIPDLLERIDPKGKKFTVTYGENNTTIKRSSPIDDKTKRIIDHIKKKISINT